jgi:hypothetical protein
MDSSSRPPPVTIISSSPILRFAQIQSQQQQQQHAEIPRIGGITAGESASQKSAPPPFPPYAATSSSSASARDELIDKNLYFNANADDSQQQQLQDDSESSLGSSNWYPTDLRTVPAFYPLEKSTRLVEDESANGVASRLSECLRYLSVQADYDNETATANLLTSENVEMCLSLWKTSHTSQQKGVLVELQRRKGDSIAFHRYSRHILDAAVGDLDIADIPDDMLNDKMYSKKVQRLLAMELKNQENQEHENAIIALEIAHSLLMKDRMDARRLGLESLCLLTDPRKTGYTTAVLTSHVVLLGSTQGIQVPGVGGGKEAQAEDLMLVDDAPFQEIREAILSLVQFSRIGEDEFDEEDVNAAMSPDAEQMTLLHNLALAVLANALDVVENPERYDTEPEDSKPSASSPNNSLHGRSRLRTASSSDVTNEFLQQTDELSNKELLSTLIGELGKAHQKPHNATLSAKCLGSLCRASDEAKRRAQELGAKNVVSTALDVGVRTHLKLETECKKVVQALERLDNDDGSSNIQQQQQDVIAAAAAARVPPPPPAAASP